MKFDQGISTLPLHKDFPHIKDKPPVHLISRSDYDNLLRTGQEIIILFTKQVSNEHNSKHPTLQKL